MRKIRIFSAVLTLCMLFSLIPAVAFAADDAEHIHSYTVKVLQEQTCEKTGVKKLTCECGDFRYEIIPQHKYDGGKVIEEATCGKAGVKAFTCTVCGISYKEVIPATGVHSYEDDTIIDATCTEPGKVGRLCSVCGAADGEITEVGEALGHDFKLDTSLEGYKAATCTEGGVNTYKCSRCDAEKTEATAATGHTWNDGELIDDCEGQYVLYSCVKCDSTMKELTGLGEVKAHNWTEGSKNAPTCTEKGSVVYVCSECGQTRSEELAALGHDMVSTVVKATCKTEGYTAHSCSRCDYKEDNTDVTPVDPKAHEAGEAVILKAPSCTVAGVKKNICKLCGASMGYVSIDPAHSWNDGEVTEAATCTENGYTGDKVCAKCGEVIEKGSDIPAAGHATELRNAAEATCTENGYTGDTVCTVCGEVVESGADIAALGHTEEVLAGKAATCTEDGLTEGKICTVCDTVTAAQEAIPAIGHDYIASAPIYSEDYSTYWYTYTCSHCNHSYNSDPIAS